MQEQITYVADRFSDLIISICGYESGLHARSAIGVQALPLNLPVIIKALVEIKEDETNSNRI